jgi:tRNA(Ile2) C34 agmatinyltransferase TiaS
LGKKFKICKVCGKRMAKKRVVSGLTRNLKPGHKFIWKCKFCGA